MLQPQVVVCLFSAFFPTLSAMHAVVIWTRKKVQNTAWHFETLSLISIFLYAAHFCTEDRTIAFHWSKNFFNCPIELHIIKEWKKFQTLVYLGWDFIHVIMLNDNWVSNFETYHLSSSNWALLNAFWSAEPGGCYYLQVWKVKSREILMIDNSI